MVVGEPSTAKSRFLGFMMSIVPAVISTTERGFFGMDLTATGTTDSETSVINLEAGKMVLADRGIVRIDES
jgi:DNA replicative helicase MCM subunit Mcm2 (Cdc46/Mcm family)